MIKLGKIGKLNAKANRELKKLFIEKGMEWCEIDIDHQCNQFLGVFYCHRHKRNFYKGKPEQLLWSFVQVILGCQNGHTIIEKNAELTADVFLRLRGQDNAND